jgi:SAM-dependent methyltransferase
MRLRELKSIAKSILNNFYLLDPARRLRRRIKHPFKPSDRTIFARYLAQSDVPKLNVGCHARVLTGWLNTDHHPILPMAIHLDTKRPFPFSKETFDYIYSAHVIEHMTYSHGVNMLRECFRVLKTSGKIRISTPDLAFLVDLTRPDKPTCSAPT